MLAVAYVHDEPITDQDVKVQFVNNTGGGPTDRDVELDALIVDGVRYETEDPATVIDSCGVWPLLRCNGTADYPVDNPDSAFTGGNAGFRLDAISIDGVSYDPVDPLVTKTGVGSAGCDTPTNVAVNVLDCNRPLGEPGSFDFSGVLDSSVVAAAGGVAVVGYQYDRAGRATQISYPGGGKRQFVYDTAGRLSTDAALNRNGVVKAEIDYTWSCDGQLA